MHILLISASTWAVVVAGCLIGLVLGMLLNIGVGFIRRRRPRAPLCICGHPLLYADDPKILTGHMRGSFDPEEGGRCLNDKCTGGPDGGPCPKYHEKV